MGASASAAAVTAAATATADPEPDAIGVLVGVRCRLRGEGLSGATTFEVVALEALLPLGVAAFAAAREPMGSPGHVGGLLGGAQTMRSQRASLCVNSHKPRSSFKGLPPPAALSLGAEGAARRVGALSAPGCA